MAGKLHINFRIIQYSLIKSSSSFSAILTRRIQIHQSQEANNVLLNKNLPKNFLNGLY